MTQQQQLPEQHTARQLGRALRAIPGLPARMIEDAERGYYHDYLSPLTFPELTLVSTLRALARSPALPAESRRMCSALALDVIAGKHDASKAEADEWAASPDGQAAMAELLRGSAARRARKGRQQ